MSEFVLPLGKFLDEEGLIITPYATQEKSSLKPMIVLFGVYFIQHDRYEVTFADVP